jgi:hypothetical protein
VCANRGEGVKTYSNRKIKRQTNLDRHGPRPITNVCHLPDPTYFSLQTTFKAVFPSATTVFNNVYKSSAFISSIVSSLVSLDRLYRVSGRRGRGIGGGGKSAIWPG